MSSVNITLKSAEVKPDANFAVARLGLIIPSVNVMAEPQFNRFAPLNMTIHIARARVAGKWKRPFAEMADEIATSAKLLSDCKPDLIVFHCTDTSMSQGLDGERRIIELIEESCGIGTMVTSRVVLEALHAMKIQKVALISPYKSNQAGIEYLQSGGMRIVRDVALGLDPADFARLPARDWTDIAIKNNGSDVDGFLLSCTNTTQIDAVEDIEQELKKPVVNSNQAVLWGTLQRLNSKAISCKNVIGLGQLFASQADRG